MKVLNLCNQVPTVGIMAAAEPGPVEKFKAGMRDCGFIEGQTVRYEVRVAHGASDKLFGFAVELVRASVDLIAVIGAVTARAARADHGFKSTPVRSTSNPRRVAQRSIMCSMSPNPLPTSMTVMARSRGRHPEFARCSKNLRVGR